MKRSKNFCKVGFTLIELLVVVAIIAVLVAMLLPALSQARNQAKRSVCLSNLRQVGSVLTLYKNDSNGFYPYGYCNGVITVNGQPYWTFWPKSLYPYHKEKNLFVCPTFAEVIAIYKGWGEDYQTTYGFNENLNWVQESQMESPATTWMLFEGYYVPGEWMMILSPSAFWRTPIHNGGSNFLFADGHAEWRDFDDIGNIASFPAGL